MNRKFLLKAVPGFVTRLFWATMWVLALNILVWYFLRWWPGDRLLPVRLLNYFLPWVLAILLPSLIIAGIAKRKNLAVVLTIPVVGIALTFAPYFFPRADVASAETYPLKVMSYNVLYTNRQVDEMVAVMRAEQPDVVLLQEVVLPMLPQFETELKTLYPEGNYYWAYEPAVAQAVVSRYPIETVGVFYDQGRAQKVLLHTPTGPVAVWNVHPRTAVGQNSWESQRNHLVALAKAIAHHDGPLIVGGDFNTTPQSDNYELVAQHLQDSHAEVGQGFEFTFPIDGPYVSNVATKAQWKLLSYRPVRQALRWAGVEQPAPLWRQHKHIYVGHGPVVRIDHIFYNDYFVAHQARTLKTAGGSDHLPIVAELSLIKPATNQ